MLELKGETIRVDSYDVYKELIKEEKVRDLVYDGRTLRVDDLVVKLKDCTLICEDDIPEIVFLDLE